MTTFILLLACSVPSNPLTAPAAEDQPLTPIIASLGPAGTPSATAPAGAAGPTLGGSAAPARVYVSLVSHNEEAPHPTCTPLVTDASVFRQNRIAVAEMARQVVAHQAAWNLQSDWAYAEAVRQWDTADQRAQTEGKNIIDYVANLDRSRVAVDAHAHETAYNYADVAAMLAALGAPNTGVAGGFIYSPSEHEAWTKLRAELTGWKNPQARWRAEILWGAATYMHQGPDLKYSGIWRPAHPDRFTEDDPSQSLVYVGSYIDGFNGVRDLLARQRAGELQAGRMYTATVFVHQCGLTTEKVNSVMADIDTFAADVAAGNLVWAPIERMVEIWQRDYGSTANIYAPPPGMDTKRSGPRGAPGGMRRGAPPAPELRAPRSIGAPPAPQIKRRKPEGAVPTPAEPPRP